MGVEGHEWRVEAVTVDRDLRESGSANDAFEVALACGYYFSRYRLTRIKVPQGVVEQYRFDPLSVPS